MEAQERIILNIEAPDQYKDSSVAILTYDYNGIAERERLGLDEKDLDDNKYIFVLSDRICNASMSYTGGLFGKSVQNITSYPDFKDKYQFEITDNNESVICNIMREIDDLYTETFFDNMRKCKETEEPKKKENFKGGFAIAVYLIVVSILSIIIGAAYGISILVIINIPALIMGVCGVAAANNMKKESRE